MADAAPLVGLNLVQLEALAEGKLAAADQLELDDLLARHAGGQLSEEETKRLDCILERVDQLNILKARAILTLEQQRLTESAKA